MNRNQKIALGCGGGGCLGLIVVVVIGGFIYLTFVKSTTYNGNRNTNFSVNTDRSTNTNTATDSDISSSLSENDKHKLFQATVVTKDAELFQRMMRKIGFRAVTDAGYAKFSDDHLAWGLKNLDFIQSVNTPEKARVYVEAHIDD